MGQIQKDFTFHYEHEQTPILIARDAVPNGPIYTSTEFMLWHEQLEIKYYLNSGSAIVIEQQQYQLQAGDMVLVNPEQPHNNLAGDVMPRYHMLVFDPSILEQARTLHPNIPLLLDRKLYFHNVIRQNERLGQEMLLFMEQTKSVSDETFPLAACGLLYHLLACLFEEKAWGLYTEEQLEQRQKANRYIRPALQYVAQHFERNITVDELADSCSLSKYHFCRQFRKLTGQTPIQYLNEYRIKRAELMLKNGRESVAEIARQVGFADESYFSRCFKAARGVSPAQVRAEQDGAAAQNRTQK